MEFDILNQLLTSTVYDLFNKTEATTIQSKQKVKELEGLIKNQSSRRNSSVESVGSAASNNYSVVSEGSNNGSRVRNTPMRPCRNVEEWKTVQAPRRLKESIQRLGISEDLLKKKSDLDAFVSAMTVDKLVGQKKKVKNELRMYDNDFQELFRNQPNHDEKEPFRPLYVYYKKLKEYITLRGGSELSQEEIEKKIREIKGERRELRQKIESYQKDFEATNNRRIRYARDIAPIQTEYKRYKDLKNQLIRLQEMLNR